MTVIVKTTREWILVFACALLFLSNFFPQGIELLYPVVDWHGGNQFNMETNKPDYHCGDLVFARMNFQKQRSIVGTVRWYLRRTDAKEKIPFIVQYAPRPVAAPTGIYNGLVPIEKLPDTCEPGQYHFEGTLTYPVWFGKVSYSMRTTCFWVKQ